MTITRESLVDLAERLDAFAEELIAPLICRDPAYGAPGFAHCAACCRGTGLVLTCQQDQDIADLVFAMHKIAREFRATEISPDPPGG